MQMLPITLITTYIPIPPLQTIKLKYKYVLLPFFNDGKYKSGSRILVSDLDFPVRSELVPENFPGFMSLLLLLHNK